jgi:hypothetical protein
MNDTAASPLPLPNQAAASPQTGRSSRWLSPLAFALGGSLTALGLATAFQTGGFDAWANTRPIPAAAMAPTPDPRVDHLLSLLEAERDCDTACLAELRGQADKSSALEQALGRLQASVSAAEQRAAAFEAEKTSLVDQAGKKAAELEIGYKQHIAALEKRAAALEAEKASLAEQASKKATELETGYKQHIAVLEKRLAETETRLQAARAERTGRKSAATRTIATAEISTAAAPTQPQTQMDTQAPASPPKWTVLGMTASSVVIATANHRVVALAAGETLDGIRIQKIDLDHGTVDTSAGVLASPQ